ncbi:MAG: PhnD/SsuA/transferrin family substrate-binding protein [Alphaproteobacteria bacterium]|nr:PhnD/SsuA/transferrin family substrate-binding protein [Alphaproteobacteria bacterium]
MQAPRVAALAMYDAPPLDAANDDLWAAIAARVPGAPAKLTRDRPVESVWTAPGLVLAQACGWPLITRLAGQVRLVATACYALPGCAGATHCGFIVVRAADPARALEDLRGRRLALNTWDSNTGMNLLRAAVAPLARNGRFFSAVYVTGTHAASLRAVAAGGADVTSVDCVTFGVLKRHRPADVAGLRVLAHTPTSPGLPLITRGDVSAAELGALRAALCATRDSPAAHALGLTGFEILPAAAYEVLREMEAEAVRRGYAALA